MPGERKQTPWQMPPRVKIYEALGAIADGRVELDAPDGGGRVGSSTGDKTYIVEVGADGREVVANDNASYWQGYLGYPAIAILIARGLYAPDASVLAALKAIPWKIINRRNRNDWERTIAEVEDDARARGFDVAPIQAATDAILAALGALAPYRIRRLRPPAGS
jgi:hypothetical protein